MLGTATQHGLPLLLLSLLDVEMVESQWSLSDSTDPKACSSSLQTSLGIGRDKTLFSFL